MSVKQSGSQERLQRATLVDATVSAIEGNYTARTGRMIGLEVELPFFSTSTLKPVTFSGPQSITALFNGLMNKAGWAADEVENGNVTSLKSRNGMVMLEQGGQVEFASAPFPTLGTLGRALNQYLDDCKAVGVPIGVDALPFAFHPHTTIEDVPFISERSRFVALKPVFESEKGFAAWGQSSSVQVTLDSNDPAHAFDSFKLGLALQPVAAAMFANSPFSQGEDSGYQSFRRQNLASLQSSLYSVPEALFDDGFTLRDWAQYTLTVPMSFVVRNDAYVPVAPNAFESMVGKPLPELGHLPEDQQYLTQKDLLDHLTGIKPEMYLKPGLLLEFRSADVGPDHAHHMAVAAFWTGLFYDKQAFTEAKDYIAHWTGADRKEMRETVARDALAANAAGASMQEVAFDLLMISRGGLMRLEPGAASLLDPVIEDVSRGLTPADRARERYRALGGDMQAFLKQSRLFAPETASVPESAPRHAATATQARPAQIPAAGR